MRIFSQLKKSQKKGFTLIESLAVIAIIGILASLTIYTITQAQRQARDAVRKSDVSAIAQGFEARALDRTCSDQSAIGIYPGESLLNDDIATNERMYWHKAIEVAALNTDRCNPFNTYLTFVPDDPRTVANYYYVNLSAKPDSFGTHYRIAAKLEKEPTDEQWKEICRQSDVWYDEFIGSRYAGCGGIINSTGRGTVMLFRYIFSPAYATSHGVCENTEPEEGNGCGEEGGSEPGGTDPTLPYNYYIGR